MRTGEIGVKLTACIIAIVAIGLAQRASAGVYPTNTCVSAKMAAAGAYCQKALKAWSIWDKKQDGAKLTAALNSAATKLSDAWGKAEEKATKKDVDCAQTTLSSPDLQSLVDGVVKDVKDEINDGLDLNNKDEAKCGSKLLNAAAKKCADLLKAEAKFIKGLDKDTTGAGRDAAKATASLKFTNSWFKVILQGCPTTTNRALIENKIDDLNDQVVMDTTVSPNVGDTDFTTITPTSPTPYLGKSLEPVCKDGSSPYYFFVKRGSVNKLLMYYQGGGACWNEVTCGGTFLTQYEALCDTTVNPSGGDNPNNQHSGFADLTNDDNPFKDWNIVFVSYCSCDIHYGDSVQDYDDYDGTPIHVVHHGFQNAKVAEKWAREHFVNPEMVFVTGSSAGSYGALFNAPLLEEVWPASQFRVLGDAGNGVITQGFLLSQFPHWNFAANLPTEIPGVTESFSGSSPTGMVGYIEGVAAYFPNTLWAHYSTAYDGSTGGQTGFYNVMAQSLILNWPKWWESSCAWNQLMVDQASTTAAAVALENDNYRYYIGTGSRHTMWGSDKVYDNTTGGVPTIVDWINAMLTGSTGWVNVEASPFNVLLSGDPQPSGTCSPNGTCSNNNTISCSADIECGSGNTCNFSCYADTDCGVASTCTLPSPFESSGSQVSVNCP
jgi:hypothetical protein